MPFIPPPPVFRGDETPEEIRRRVEAHSQFLRLCIESNREAAGRFLFWALFVVAMAVIALM